MPLALNHLNLAIADVATLRDYFLRHFAFAEVARRGDAFVVLRDARGLVLSLMRDANATYPRTFHVGFLLDDADAVTAKHAELHAAGERVGDVESIERGGFASVTFYAEAPSGVLVEVSYLMEAA